MNRIDVRLNQVRQEGKKAFIPFITAGDPNLAATKKLVLAMAELGADVIELGIPFSDPMAEGPVIQAANERALRSDIDTDAIMDMAAELRRETQVPLVYLLYYNSILSYGREAFFRRCAECGADGVIIPDLPYEERDEVEEYADRYGADVPRAAGEDRLLRERIFVLRLVPGRDRGSGSLRDEFSGILWGDPAVLPRPHVRWIWHLHAGAGGGGESLLRRRYRGERHRKAGGRGRRRGRADASGVRACAVAAERGVGNDRETGPIICEISSFRLFYKLCEILRREV